MARTLSMNSGVLRQLAGGRPVRLEGEDQQMRLIVD